MSCAYLSMLGVALLVGTTLLPEPAATGDGGSSAANPVFEVPRAWEYSAPWIAPEKREVNPSQAQKDPSVVFYGGRWHVFMTVKLTGRSAIEYCSFAKWEDANASCRTILPISDSDYYCAPQVFYFRPIPPSTLLPDGTTSVLPPVWNRGRTTSATANSCGTDGTRR